MGRFNGGFFRNSFRPAGAFRQEKQKRKKLLKAQRKALKRADHPFESDKAADCRGVVLSNRAYLSVLSEVYFP